MADQDDYLAAEARARVRIDEILSECGWLVQSDVDLNLTAGPGVAVREVTLKEGHGRVDYLLFVTSQYGPHKISVYAKGSFPEGYKLSESDVTVLPRLPASGKTVWTPNPSGDAVKPEPGQKPGQLPGEAPKAKPEEEKKK